MVASGLPAQRRSRWRIFKVSTECESPAQESDNITAVWVFDWLFELKGLDQKLFSDKLYPQTYAWVHRFQSTLKNAKSSVKKPVTLKGLEAAKYVASAEYTDKCVVDGDDPSGLREGQVVEFWPTDSGFNHRDQGRLVKLTKDEMAISLTTKLEGKEIRLHAPRWNFRIRAVKSDASKL
jgi:hypothetical protein